MHRSVTIALASALVILAPSEVLARGGGGHGGGGGGHGGGFGGFGGGGGHVGHAMGMGHVGAVGFRAMPGAMHGGRFDRHVVGNRFHHRKVFFIGGDGDYYSCWPIWNGYYWVNSCGYGY
jgi:hypothetical protein